MKRIMIVCCILSAAMTAACDDLADGDDRLVIAGGEKIDIATSLSQQEIENLILSGDGYWTMKQSFTYKTDSKGNITKVGSDYCNFTPPMMLEGFAPSYYRMAFNDDGTVDLYENRPFISGPPHFITKTVCSYTIQGNSIEIVHLTDQCKRQENHRVTGFTLKVVGISDGMLVLDGELWTKDLTHDFDTFKLYPNRRSVFVKQEPLNDLLKRFETPIVTC